MTIGLDLLEARWCLDSCGLIPLGPVNNGIAAPDSATGTGYIMYSAQSVHTRFSGVMASNSNHVISVQYLNNQWYVGANEVWVAFTPVDTDQLIATVNYTADTISSLQGTSGQVSGINAGYAQGNLTFAANIYGGNFNKGEFTVSGTNFTVLCPEIELSGNGQIILSGDTTPAASDGTDWGSVPLNGSPASRPFSIHNLGSDPLTLTGSPLVSIVGSSAFQVSQQPASNTVAGSSSSVFEVTLSPTSTGIQNATVQITSNDSDEPLYSFALTALVQNVGSGGPQWEVFGKGQRIVSGDTTPHASDGTDFGEVYVAAGMRYQEFTVSNPGTSELTISNIDLSPSSGTGISVSSVSLPLAIPSGGTSTFALLYDPITNGGSSATVTLSSNSPSGTYSFDVAGTGSTAPFEQTVNLGAVNRGIQAIDTATGLGYLMYSPIAVQTRFANVPSTDSTNLISVQFNSALQQWQYGDSLSVWVPFTPMGGDRLLAGVNYTTDAILPLQNQFGTVFGIEQGYLSGNLIFTANVYNNRANAGEFTVTGTQFTIPANPTIDGDDQISESIPLNGLSKIDAIETLFDVDTYAIPVSAGQRLTFTSSPIDSSMGANLRLSTADGTMLSQSVGSPSAQGYQLNAGTLGTVRMDASGRGYAEVDYLARKVTTTNRFYVATWGVAGATGTVTNPFRNVSDAIASLNSQNIRNADLILSAGSFTWGTVSPKFSMNLIGKGPGQTILQGTSGATNVRSTLAVSLYIEGVSILGGSAGIDGRNGLHFTIVDSEIAYTTASDGLNLINFQSAVVYRTHVHDNWLDGLSYHNPNGQPMQVLEAFVKSNDNGKTNVFNSQGSTTHDTVQIVRVASEYRRNRTNIADVSSNTSWNVDITTSNPTDPAAFNFYQSSGGTAYLMSGDSSQGGMIRVINGGIVRYSSFYSIYDERTSVAAGSTLIGPDNSQLTPVILPTSTSASLSYDFTTAGTYYLSVSGPLNTSYSLLDGSGKTYGGGLGRYQIVVTQNASSTDSDDQMSEATLASGPSTINAMIDFSSDVDLYAFSVVAGQTHTFDLDVTSPLLDLRLRLFDSSGVPLASNDDGVGLNSEFSIWESFVSYTFSSTGTFYLGVSSYENADYSILTGLNDQDGGLIGSYQLIVS